jgi:hypothetical protein
VLAEACPPVLRRLEGHGAGREKEERLPSVDVAYCDVCRAWYGDE